MDLAFERRAWTLIYLCLGVIEGGTAGLMVRALFGGAVAGIIVDLVLAVISAAPAWANLASLVYARRAQGRPKVQFLRPLMLAMAVCVGSIAPVRSSVLLSGQLRRPQLGPCSASIFGNSKSI